MNLDLRNIMTTNLCKIATSASITEALTLMDEKRIRHLPVIDMNFHIVGVVSQRDLLVLKSSKFICSELTVEQFMSSPVELIEQSNSIRSVILRMLEKKISSVLICDEREFAVGIITTDDVLWYLAHLLENEKEKHRSLWDIASLQTIGDIALRLSNIGI